MSMKKLAGITIACTIAIIVVIVLFTFKPWEATPSAETHTLTIIVSPSGAGSVSPSGGEYESGDQVTLTASPASGYTFDHWSGDASNPSPTIVITMDSDKNIIAYFEEESAIVEATVTRVIDGDTIEVNLEGLIYRVRYIGIDTPEIGEPCADEATEANRQLVEGKTAWLEKDISETDKYGRLLRYVYVDDVFVNEELVRLGLALPSSYPPDIKHDDTFSFIGFMARKYDVVGIWSPSCFQQYINPAYGYSIGYPLLWEILDTSGTQLILVADIPNRVTVHASDFPMTAEFYIDYISYAYEDYWENFDVSYSHSLTGKWDWVLGFTYTNVFYDEPFEGIGEAYITQGDEFSFVVQWDGTEILSDESKRVVDTFELSSPPKSEYLYVGSINSNIYHYPSCIWAQKIKPENEIWFSSPEDAWAHGYRPCEVCKPP